LKEEVHVHVEEAHVADKVEVETFEAEDDRNGYHGSEAEE